MNITKLKPAPIKVLCTIEFATECKEEFGSDYSMYAGYCQSLTGKNKQGFDIQLEELPYDVYMSIGNVGNVTYI